MTKAKAAAKASKSTKSTKPGLAYAPCIYINDASSVGPDVSLALAEMMPNAVLETGAVYNTTWTIVPKSRLPSGFRAKKKTSNPMDTAVYIFMDENTDLEAASATAKAYRAAAIKYGCNFASVNLTKQSASEPDDEDVEWDVEWGTNHLDLEVGSGGTQAAAEKIYKWLFTVFTVPETLHLIPNDEMLEIDEEHFPGHVYCPLADMSKKPKNAKVQNVVLIVSKPQVGSDQRVNWKVVDRTGEAKYYFRYKGPESQTTWDWVLSFQPGDRKALARMPKVCIKERKRVKVLKAPFRAVAAVAVGTGLAISNAGKGLIWVGGKLHMGPSEGKWVSEDEVAKEGKATTKKVVAEEPQPAPEKNDVTSSEKDEKALWKDEDNDASTTAGSVMDEKEKAEFC